MKISPKINFLLWMLPIKLTEEELKQWQSIINNFSNGNKKPRINKKIWYISQKEGGLGIPNISKYYIANQMRNIPRMVYGLENVLWGELELGELKDKDYLLSTQGNKWLKNIKNPISNVTLQIWHKNKNIFIPEISPLIRIVDLKKFPENPRIVLVKDMK